VGGVNPVLALAMKMNLKRIESRSDDANAHYEMACAYAVRGDREKAFEHLKLFNQYEKHGELFWVTYKKNDSMLNILRIEPGFQKIIMNVESGHHVAHEIVKK
jgi:hypothetical protein